MALRSLARVDKVNRAQEAFAGTRETSRAFALLPFLPAPLAATAVGLGLCRPCRHSAAPQFPQQRCQDGAQAQQECGSDGLRGVDIPRAAAAGPRHSRRAPGKGVFARSKPALLLCPGHNACAVYGHLHPWAAASREVQVCRQSCTSAWLQCSVSTLLLSSLRFADAQDSIGNYYDCRLTLAPAVVGAALCHMCFAAAAVAWLASCLCLLRPAPPAPHPTAPTPTTHTHDTRIHTACSQLVHTRPQPTPTCRLVSCPQDPVCTPKGFLFSREAILENLLEQKKANKRKLAAWEAQQADEARKQARPAPPPRVPRCRLRV